ncbi:MAG: gluconate 2-dehydrogenase subunit 3 family protein [Acidobacteria bacterium]|nr:gluconate 2-dehydrogenase subunit 3 family protein [Acidobacteriota bacterium]
MPIQRRRFFQSIAAASAASTLSAQPAALTLPAKVATVAPETAAESVQRFFTVRQLTTLRHAASLLQPAVGALPGAIEAAAPEFLDFLLSVSPEPRQTLYRSGLDHLDSQANKLFQRPFSGLSAAQADQVLKPLIVAWTFDPPTDPHQRFLTELRADLRTATTNSAPYAKANANNSRRRRGPGGAGFYWLPIDPTRR